MSTVIYALLDPFSKQPRYVGKTKNLKVRLRQHMNRAAHQTHIASAQWLDGLNLAGVAPIAVILETVEADWEAAERFWIASFKAVGNDLLNMTAGGGATLGHAHTEETKRKLAERHREQFSDPAMRVAARNRTLEQWQSPAFREMRSASARSNGSDPAYRAKQREIKLALWKTAEYAEKVSEAHRNADHRGGALKMWARPEYREAQARARERRKRKAAAE